MSHDPDRRRRVYLHLGAPKTGTTYLQSVLWNNHAALAERGLLLPGRGMAAQHQAALDLRRVSFGGGSARRRGTTWQSLADESNGWRGDVLVSSELLAWTGPPEIEEGLRIWPGRDVHLVMTVRDLLRQLPAVWQEEVKNRRTLTYAEFVEEAVAADAMDGGPGGLWGGQDPRQVFDRWGADVPAERIHVVTVPPPGQRPTLLLERFCEVLGIDAEGLDVDLPRSNASVGLAEAELIRQVSLRLGDDVAFEGFSRLVKHGLAESPSMAARPDGRIQVPDSARSALARRAEGIRDHVLAQRYDVVGDLDDLAFDAGPTGSQVVTPHDRDLVDAGLRACVELVRALDEHPAPRPPWRERLAGRSLAERRRAVLGRARAVVRRAVPRPVRAGVRRLLG